VTLQNNLSGASWSVAPLESDNISKHITDVMTLFHIHCFSFEVRLIKKSKYCMQTKVMLLKVCVFICGCGSVYHSFFSQLVPN
jgi:predicted nucleotide-binding protein (sugar kinase/HSP70/actin superfamily)